MLTFDVLISIVFELNDGTGGPQFRMVPATARCPRLETQRAGTSDGCCAEQLWGRQRCVRVRFHRFCSPQRHFCSDTMLDVYAENGIHIVSQKYGEEKGWRPDRRAYMF